MIIKQIKKKLTIANIKANDTNTFLDLTNEVKQRIETLIQDKQVSFELTSNEKSESKLEEKSYHFNIDLNYITADDEKIESLSDRFSIAVKKATVDLEQQKQQLMKQLAQLDQAIEVKLLKKKKKSVNF